VMSGPATDPICTQSKLRAESVRPTTRIVAAVTSSPDVGRQAAEPTAADDALVDAIAQLSFAVQFVLIEVGALHDLSMTQVRLLGILRDRTGSMGELAGYLRLDKSSVTGLVSRAEARDLVRRARRPGDGRGVQVVITERGAELAAQVHREVAARLLSLTETLDVAERSTLTALIDRMINLG
jgi:DNA-binding MarR family transcriptional regulator